MSQAESRLSRVIIRAIEDAGGFAYKNHGSQFSLAGLPDITACVDGKFYGLEVKRPNQRDNTSAVQELVMTRIRLAGGNAQVVCSVTEALTACGLNPD